MTYQRYIKRNGKLYGPYTYKSIRKGNKIISQYVGESSDLKKSSPVLGSSVNSVKESNYAFSAIPKSLKGFGSNLITNFSGKRSYRFLLVIIFILLVLSGIFFLGKPTGVAVLGPSLSYKINETMQGNLKIHLKPGELLPADSLVILKLNNQEKSIPISELVSMEQSSGNFYVENREIAGQGAGYGVSGEKIEYPEINFEFRLIKEAGTPAPESNVTQEVNVSQEISEPEENQTSGEESAQEIPSQETPVQETSGNESFPQTDITGGIIVEDSVKAEASPDSPKTIKVFEDNLHGKVSKNSEFSYNIGDNDAEIISVDRGSIEDSVKVKKENGVLTISTNYSEIEEGFGQDYLGSENVTLQVDIGKFEILAEVGTLDITLSYNNASISQISKRIIAEGSGESEILANISNMTQIANVTLNETAVGNVSTKTKNYKIVLNRPVKWQKRISGDIFDATIELPREAENISIKIRENITLAEQEAEKEVISIEQNKSALITGQVSLELGIREKGILTKVFEFLGRKLKISGRATEDITSLDKGTVTQTQTSKIIDLNESSIMNESEVLIEYETPAPVSVEENTSSGKKVTISAASELNYTDILSFTEIPEKLNVGEEPRIKVYWKEEIKYIDFTAYDLDENGKLDYIEWITPHLSNQTFEIIFITNAEELDSNRIFIRDVYEHVKSKDNNWTQVISGNYLRVSFEQNLTRDKDITIYARANETSEIEVYRENDTELIAKFENISQENWYKVYLTNLSENESWKTFDLKVLGNIEFDYVVDPQANDSSNNVYQCGTLDSPGTYLMNQSIINDTLVTPCINITSQNITLNCAGYTISSAPPVSLIYTNQINTTIKNCNFAAMASGESFIELNKANNSYVFNNTGLQREYGVRLTDTYYTRIENNTLRIQDPGIGAIYLNTSDFNNITGNIIANNPGEGIVLVTSKNNLIEKNTLSVSYRRSVYLQTSSTGNIINNNNIYNCTSTTLPCIYITGSNNNTISNSSFNLSASDIIYIDTSNNTLLENLNLYESAKNLTRLTGNSLNTKLLNVSYDNEAFESVASGSELIRKWYYRAYVNDTVTGAVIQSANVTAYNVSNSYQFNLTTDATGYTGLGEIIDYVNTGTKTYYSNYNIYAVNTSYPSLNHSFNASLGNNYLDIFSLSSAGSSSCGNLDVAGRTYTLTANLIPSGSIASCINITNQNITLDCAGYWISNTTLAVSGIYSNQINTTIKNCNITMSFSSPGYGINLAGANNSKLINNTANSNYRGIYLLYNSSNNILSGNTANANNHSGIAIYLGSNNNTIDSNFISLNPIGVYLNSSSYNNLTSNIINTSSSDCIVLRLSSNNNIIFNNTLTPGRIGIYIGSNSNNNQIIGNYQAISPMSGIYLNSSSNNTISGNTFIGNSQAGINLYMGNYNNLILNNTANSNVVGVYLYQNSNNNTIENNTANSNTDSGIYFYSNSGNNATGNSLSLNKYGITLYTSSSNVLTNNNISSSSTYGIYLLLSANNNIFDNGKVSSSIQDLVYLSSSNNNLFRNVQLTTTSGVHATLTSSSINNTFLNVSEDSSGLESVALGSQLIKAWWYKAYVNDSSGNNVSNANVTAYNVSNSYQFNLTTDATGYTPLQSIIDYVNTGGTATYYSNYTIYAGNTSYPTVSHSYNATSNQNNYKDVFSLDNSAPAITIILPLNNSNFNISSVGFNVSMNENSSWCGISISGAANQTMTLNSTGTGGNYTNSSIADGSYNFIVTCNDTSNNYGVSSRYNFLVDSVFPTLNVTSPVNTSIYNSSSVLINVSSSELGTGSIVPNLDSSLVSWWRMDDVNATTGVIDYMGRNNGTKVENAAQTDAGKFGKGFSFDGSVDRIQGAASDNFNILVNKSFSIFTWFNKNTDCGLNAGAKNEIMLTRTFPGQHTSNTWWAGCRATTDKFAVYFFPASKVGDDGFIESSAVVDDGQWHYGGFVYDGSAGELKLYLDGNLQGTDYINLTADFNSTHDLCMGGYGIGTLCDDYTFNGTLDDVMVFNRSLSAEEITSLYNATKLQYTQTGLTEGSHSYKAYTQDLGGNIASSNLLGFSVDTTFPQINFTGQTPANGSTQAGNSIYVNISSSDANQHYVVNNFDNSLVSWWRMDDVNSSGNPIDAIGQRNATATSGAVQTSAGKFGKGFEFDSVDDFLSYASNIPFNSNDFSISAWVKIKGVGGAGSNSVFSQKVLGTGNGKPGVFLTITSPANQPYFSMRDNVGAVVDVTADNVLNYNGWYHVVAVKNSSLISLYVGGVFNKSTSHTLSGDFDEGSIYRHIGRNIDSSYFNGTIDDVIIFNRSLSVSEILALYNATASQYYNNFTGLADGVHTMTGYAVDSGGNVNTTGVRSVTVQSDATYPIFSNYYDNNATLVGSGTAWFNVTVANTNGTVGLTFNETNYTASNLTSNVYNVSISLSTNGTYNYTWFAYGNGTNHLYNNSQTFSYSVLVDTNISSCGNLDTAGRTYTLAANLIPTGSIASCLNITAQNITLDCAGFWISNTTLAVSGIYSNQINTTIRNCNVTMGSGSGGIGVYLVGANNSYVYNCNLNGQRRGIYLLSTGNIILDKIITNSNTLDGIILVSSLGNTLTNITANLNPTGIKISTSSNNNTLTNITANSNAYGIEFSLNSNNNSLNSITANSNTQNGIIMGTDSNNIIKNSNFSLNTNTDVYLGLTSSNNTFLNCSYDSEYVASGSQLIRKWYYQAYVSDTKARVILNANITAFNRTGGYEVNLSTNELGLTGLGAMTEYVNNGTRNYYSNYTIYAGKSGYFSANHSFNLTGNTFRDEFSLLITDTTFPLIEWAEGTAVDYANVSRNWIYANISFSELNFENISFTLYNSSGTVNSTIFTTATYNINWTNLSEGNYTYIVNITDIGNNQNSTSLRHITLDRTAPNVSFSCSPSSVSIGGVVTCSCAAVDNLGTVLSYVSNPPTVSAGSFTATCTASDAAGNSNSANSAYSVEGAGSGPGGGGTGGAGGTGERINVSVVANGSCLEHWECTWSECNSFNISSPLVCRDLNNCGTNRSYPGSKICGELTPLEMNYSSWTCGEWGECQMDYSLSTLTGSTQIEKKQIRECTEIGGQKKEIIKRDCYLFKSASIKKATWCEERYIEIYDNSSGQLVGMIKETSSDKKNVDISFVFTNATRYCAYCFDGIKDYDETGLDCGGVHCPVCFETPKKSWFNYRIAVAILWAGLLLLLAYLASYFARTVQVTYSAWRRKKRS